LFTRKPSKKYENCRQNQEDKGVWEKWKGNDKQRKRVCHVNE